MSAKRLVLTLVSPLLLGICTHAAAFEVKQVEQAPPEGVSEAVSALLAPQAVQLIEDGRAVWEFWFVKEAPLTEPPATVSEGLSKVPEAALLGVVRVHRSQRDYRDDEVYEDTYTLRFVHMPQDGNHLGVSEFLYYVALVPVEKDQAPDALKTYRQVVKASGADTATDHPIVLSLRPVESGNAEIPELYSPLEDHEAVRVSIGEAEAGQLIFGLVYSGHGKL
jgi:hypothetical protein